MKRLNLISMLAVAVVLVFASCKKDETSTPDPTPTPTPTPQKMASFTGTWTATGTGIPEDERANYSSFELKILADSTCTWTKTHKTNPSGTLAMQGKVFVEATEAKDANGKLIDKIWFSFNKINGQDLSGSTHGIYQVDGNTLHLDWEFMQNGVVYPDPTKGFGSGAKGQKTVSKYTK